MMAELRRFRLNAPPTIISQATYWPKVKQVVGGVVHDLVVPSFGGFSSDAPPTSFSPAASQSVVKPAKERKTFEGLMSDGT